MDRPRSDREMRELMIYLRDTFTDAAARIDSFLARSEEAPRGPLRPAHNGRDFRDDRNDRAARDDRWSRNDRPAPMDNRREFSRGPAAAPNGNVNGNVAEGGRDEGQRMKLESIREEVRKISDDAPEMDPGLLRLTVEALTAETRILQARVSDPEDGDIAAKIMRALTAIVSEHRPGHVYGLARHHQADWEELARRARAEIAAGGNGSDAHRAD